MTSCGRLLALFAHPDDESMLAGGTIAAAGAVGFDTLIVTATRGEAGPGGGGGQLAERRMRELEEAAEILGADVGCLEMGDGYLTASLAELERRIGALAADWMPTVIVTFAEDGWYWHPDHVAVYRAVSAIIPFAQPEIAILGATWPRYRMRRLVRAARAAGVPADVWGLDPDAFGSPASEIDVVITLGHLVDRKRRALAAHASQMASAPIWSALPECAARTYLGSEFLVRESDTPTDVFLPFLDTGGVHVRIRDLDRRPAMPST